MHTETFLNPLQHENTEKSGIATIHEDFIYCCNSLIYCMHFEESHEIWRMKEALFLNLLLCSAWLRKQFASMVSRLRAIDETNVQGQTTEYLHMLVQCIYLECNSSSQDENMLPILKLVQASIISLLIHRMRKAQPSLTTLTPLADFCSSSMVEYSKLTLPSRCFFALMTWYHTSILRFVCREPIKADIPVNLRLIIALSSWNAGQYTTATEILRETLTTGESACDVHNLIGASLSMKGCSSEAVSYFHRSLKANPTFLLPLYNIVYEYQRSKKFDVCLQILDLIIQAQKSVQSHQGCQQKYYITPEDNLRLCSHHPTPSTMELYLLVADISLQASDWNASIYYYELYLDSIRSVSADDAAVRESSPSYSVTYRDPQDIVTVLRNYAHVLIKGEQPTKAIRVCDSILDWDSCDVVSLLYKTNAFAELNQYQEALSCAEQVISIMENMHRLLVSEKTLNPEVWKLFDRLVPKPTRVNIDLFNSKQKRREIEARARCTKGVCMIAQGDATGEEYLKASWETFPESDDLCYNYCLCLLKKSQQQDAVGLYLHFRGVNLDRQSQEYTAMIQSFRTKDRSFTTSDSFYVWCLSFYRDYMKKKEVERELEIADELFRALDGDDMF
eukprot:TRINITY_DN9908_c0_g1_i4.p1 TRINITY_DN9908_c0_g1~~TRINITY_DN9908_c0_g1_i4.p1  ORF type:complete len:619 (+),score=106.09 TRINITY_DN9908_c0_g1_i4:744-2600(+)